MKNILVSIKLLSILKHPSRTTSMIPVLTVIIEDKEIEDNTQMKTPILHGKKKSSIKKVKDAKEPINDDSLFLSNDEMLVKCGSKVRRTPVINYSLPKLNSKLRKGGFH